ncbi:MAG: hypothetical protein JXO22_08725 [Phycisphaerae bacterium]|nr:hypothetical protein [Phycisphaerae bacterium]
MTDQTRMTASHNCRVIVARRDDQTGRVHVDYPDLPPGARAELEAIFGCRRYPMLIASDELRAVRERHGTPPLALLQTVAGPDALPLPEPTTTPFQPLCLDDTLAALGSLLAPEAAEDVVRSEPPVHQQLRRTVTPLLVPAVSLTWLAAWMVGLWLVWSEIAQHRAGTAIGLSCFGVVMVMYWLAVVQLARVWYVLPGGLAHRRIGLSLLRWQWEVLTPDDTVLCVVETGPGWRATLDASGVVRGITLSRLESAALLAAWTSPLTPPSADELERVK